MADDIETGMETADMKRLLMKSKTEPVNCAVGLHGKLAVMMLHKIKQPKALSKDLEKQFDDLKNARFGTAFVDTDDDPKLVILTLNRAASGLGQKLRKTLKGTGFSKVRIQLEDGSVAENVGEEDEEGEEDGKAAAAPAQPGAAAPESAAEPAAATFDPAALTQRLTGLVKQMLPIIAADPSRQGDLKDLAGKAQTGIKSGDEGAATKAVDALEAALKGSGDAKPNGAAAPNMAVLAKSKLAWVAARKRVEDELGKLHAEMTKHYDGHGFGADLDKVFQSKVDPIMGSLDQRLGAKLDEVAQNANPGQHAKLVQEARAIISGYESFIAGEPLIAQLDSNPFVPLSIQKTLSATLQALSKSVT